MALSHGIEFPEKFFGRMPTSRATMGGSVTTGGRFHWASGDSSEFLCILAP
jgi:hypothetical protein